MEESQKNEMKTNTSDRINRIIPHCTPIVTTNESEMGIYVP